MSSNGSEVLANSLFSALMAGETEETIDLNSVQIPNLLTDITRMSIADVTSGTVEGTGAFDQIMVGIRAHLEAEYAKGRISGAEYTKAFIALTEAAMGQAVQFILNRDSAYWNALLAQVNAQVTAQLNIINARIGLKNSKAEFALTKLKLATEDANYALVGANTNLVNANKDIAVLKLETEGVTIDLLKEQVEAQRAQTLGTRSNGDTVAGVMGSQVALYNQQITSYQRDAEVKAAKPFIDAWVTMKSIDEGLAAPANFSNANLDVVLGKIRANNGLN